MGKSILFIACVVIASYDLSAFDSYEHIATGTMGVKLKFPGQDQVYEDFPYKAYYEMLLDPINKPKVGTIEYHPQYILVQSGNKTLKLSYGEIIALAGDFIGSTEVTISNGVPLKHFESMRPELEENFKRHFANLLPYDQNPVYQNNNLEYLRGLFKNEYKHLILTLDKKHGVHFNNASSHSVTCKLRTNMLMENRQGTLVYFLTMWTIFKMMPN